MSGALDEIAGVSPVGDPYVFGRLHPHAATLRGDVKGVLTVARAMGKRANPKAKFLIFGRARSGTTLLCRLLDTVPDIHCDLEVLHYRVPFPLTYLRQAMPRTAGAPIYGCKLLSYQLVEVQKIKTPESFFARLAQDGFRFIHSTRETLTQCMSLSIAQATRVYLAERGGVRKDATTLDPDLFVRQVRWNEALLRLETRLLAPYDPIRVHYETDLLDPAQHQATIDRVCKFLGTESHAVAAPMQKVLKKGFDDMVENADAVRAAVHAAGLSHVFEPGR